MAESPRICASHECPFEADAYSNFCELHGRVPADLPLKTDQPLIYTYLCTGDNYWGKGPTVEQAKKQFRIAGGSLRRKHSVYRSTGPVLQLTDYGDLTWSKGYPCEKLNFRTGDWEAVQAEW